MRSVAYCSLWGFCYAAPTLFYDGAEGAIAVVSFEW